jgi:hypothetical protein
MPTELQKPSQWREVSAVARRIAPVLILDVLLAACVASQQPAVVAATIASPAYETGELDRQARLMGYHVEIRHEQRLYCQRSAPVGTHIETNHCLNAELMAQAARDEAEMKNQLSLRNNARCPSCIQKND